MEAPWHPIVLNILADMPHWFGIITDLIKNVSVGWVLQLSTITAFNTLATQRCVLYRQVFSPSVFQAVVGITQTSIMTVNEQWTGCCV